MSDSQKQAAYDQYQNAETEGTLVGLHDARAMTNDFLHFINNWEEGDYDAVDVSVLGNVSYAREAFYRTLMSTTFHTVYSNTLNPPAQGPANTHVVEVSKTDDDFTLHHMGLTQSNELITLSAPIVEMFNSRSIVFKEGVVMALFKLTTKTINGAPVWNYQMAVNGRLRFNYYLVPFKLRQ